MMRGEEREMREEEGETKDGGKERDALLDNVILVVLIYEGIARRQINFESRLPKQTQRIYQRW